MRGGSAHGRKVGASLEVVKREGEGKREGHSRKNLDEGLGEVGVLSASSGHDAGLANVDGGHDDSGEHATGCNNQEKGHITK